MNGSTPHSERPDLCRRYSGLFQDYLDGDLAKPTSLELFLHLRECSACQTELEQTKQVFQALGSMPPVPVPEDFDAKILKAVPYEAYRQMEPIRRDRVPVFLEEDFLPAPIRATTTRWAGGLLAGFATLGLIMDWLPDLALVVVIGGLIPEALVRMQRFGRRLTLSGQRSTSG
jgi:anti-sigma factor RsiW